MNQEALYPDFHNVVRDTLDKQNPQGLIAVFSSFFATIGDQAKFKFNFCFCDGLLNIFQTGQKEKQDLTLAYVSFRDEHQV